MLVVEVVVGADVVEVVDAEVVVDVVVGAEVVVGESHAPEVQVKLKPGEPAADASQSKIALPPAGTLNWPGEVVSERTSPL